MQLLEKLVNVIYPPKCIFCRQLLRYDTELHICGTCREKLPFSREVFLAIRQGGGDSCCDGAVSVLQYTGMVKESLIRFKFYRKPGYYITYARLIAYRLRNMTDVTRFNMVMSVPLHSQREFSRGYNQAYLISRSLGRELRLAEHSYLLKRSRNTETQSLLDKQNRHSNVQGAFRVTAPGKVKGKSILLVDDILTTGSTLEECSRMLKQAGASEVIAAVVATGRKY